MLRFLSRRSYFKPPVYTSTIAPHRPSSTPIPTIRLLSPDGKKAESTKHTADQKTLRLALRSMINLRTMDSLLYDAQRQGRISFYMTSTGEEAIHFGASLAIHPGDPLYAQYRETGVLLARGFGLPELMAQVCGNWRDGGKGRQMPVHYGSAELKIQTISSPLGTQLPQAVGAAYFHKLHRTGDVPVCFFGEGAASEGDFHAALNMAATLKTPLLFLCRNNTLAISTPLHEQYAGDGIAARAAGYGIPAFRVDGADLPAVWAVVEQARKLAIEQSSPVLVEAIALRLGHHSTSDDSSAYRSLSQEDRDGACPIRRLAAYLGVTSEECAAMEAEHRVTVLQALNEAEKQLKPAISEMFTDVYAGEVEGELAEQQEALKTHLKKHGDAYNLSAFK